MYSYYKVRGISPPAGSTFYAPPPFRSWFAEQVAEIDPDIVLVNYALWTGLIADGPFQGRVKILETHDLFSLNSRMQTAVLDALAACQHHPYENSPVLSEDFFDQTKARPDAAELSQYDKYDFVIAISQDEARLIQKHSEHAKVVFIPFVMKPASVRNSYMGSGVFAMGPNAFNVQGYHYLAQRVIPRVRSSDPDIEFRVTGEGPSGVPLPSRPGVVRCGFVPMIGDVYQDAGFALCPILGGTGQQVKIVEAMAHGLAVVALRGRAASSPIVHGENGFVVDNADEFARCVIRLSQDRELRETMGRSALATAEKAWIAAADRNPWAQIVAATGA
jgi:glycosyltransferase involved in cell wall biosynthesis